MDRVQELGPGVEFYPVDSLSRGMVDRMSMMDRSMPNMVYLPYDNMDDNWTQHEVTNNSPNPDYPDFPTVPPVPTFHCQYC